MRKYQPGFLILALLAAASVVISQPGNESRSNSASAAQEDGHIMVTPDQVKWGPAPPSLPPGSQLAVLEGDPSKAGVSFTIRARMPDGYKIPPHWHPNDENVTVVQGMLMIGMGDKFDESAGSELPTGSYALMPKSVRHFAWAKGETIIDVYGIGPFAITYVNPSDDPRRKAK